MSFTKKALNNFQISGLTAHPVFAENLCLVKKACARANRKAKRLSAKDLKAVEKACDAVLKKGFDDNFVVDVFQAGAGTSFNMNMNELIADRARLHPNDHINLGQSSNNVIPTTIRLSSLHLANDLLGEMDKLESVLRAKARSCGALMKVGRTHLQDAVPMAMKDEFLAYAESVSRTRKSLKNSLDALSEISLGANAIGTSINNPKNFRTLAVKELAKLTKLKLRVAKSPVMMTQSMQDFAQVSSAVKNVSLELGRIANDMRLLSSGPLAGMAEVILPTVQPGSSIMPGKVNPSIAECLNMICFQVQGNDHAVSLAVAGGQLEHNVFTPTIAFNLLWSLEILANGVSMFREKCVKGIHIDKKRVKELLVGSLSFATKLVPVLGYDETAALVKEALKSKSTLKELVLKKKLVTLKKLEALLR